MSLDNRFLHRNAFSDDHCFHFAGLANTLKIQFWGTENLEETQEHEFKIKNVTFWCAEYGKGVVDSYQPNIDKAEGIDFFSMLDIKLTSEAQHFAKNYVVRQYGAPPQTFRSSIINCIQSFLFHGLEALVQLAGQQGHHPWAPESICHWSEKNGMYWTSVLSLRNIKRKERHRSRQPIRKLLKGWTSLENWLHAVIQKLDGHKNHGNSIEMGLVDR